MTTLYAALIKQLAWLGTLEQNAPRIAGLPTWVNPVGWLYHVVLGSAVTLIAGAGGHTGLSFLIGFGLANEYRDGDLLGPTGPWDGLCDLAAFLAPALLRPLL